jgi:hypothetical protein
MTHHDLAKQRGEVLGLITFFPRAIATSYTTAILCSSRDRFALDHSREQGEGHSPGKMREERRAHRLIQVRVELICSRTSVTALAGCMTHLYRAPG